ncbi:50S ribosomal protein L19 [bacterium]|nr:50S ribosomal protein L19 [bacterium]|tara:strand:- start:1758 stop:2321 length:564 start_codon:yes stop_codon:yes gene_type:complete
MTSATIKDGSATYVKPRPEVRPGFTVRVHERIQEGGKERVQVFEGLVISVHKGATAADQTFTVRRIASGVGVEKVFPLHSPKIDKIEVKKVARVRRAKLFFLRGRRGKSARLSERFTTADEFAVATPVEPEPVEEEVIEEAVEAAKEKDAKDAEDAKEPTEEVKKEEEAPAEGDAKDTEDSQESKEK